MYDRVLKLDANDTWLCEHVDESGAPAPSTRLHFDETLEYNAGRASSVPRRHVRCPDCDTYWRVWVKLRVAKAAIWPPSTAPAAAPRLRHAPVVDIDRVLDLVRKQLPAVEIHSNINAWPADDEGLWVFRLSGVANNIQLESGSGMCPFIVEHSGMMKATDAWTANSVDEAAMMVVDYLSEQKK